MSDERSATWSHHNYSLLNKDLECFSNRGTADTEVSREFVLGLKFVTFSQSSLDDVLLKAINHHVAESRHRETTET